MFYIFLAFDVSFYLVAMSKRTNLVKLAKKMEEKKDKEGSKATTSSTNGVVIQKNGLRKKPLIPRSSKRAKLMTPRKRRPCRHPRLKEVQ